MKVDIKEMLRFSLAGGLVNAVDLGIYYGLIHFLPYAAAKAISFTCAGILGFLLSKYWTFKNDTRFVRQMGRFALINTLALGINVLVNHVGLSFYPNSILSVLIVATLLTNLFTFITFKWWVFS